MRTVLFALGVLLLLAAIVLVAKRKEAALVAGLPVRIVCADQAAALAQAGPAAIPVLGTGSMAPYIPSALPGRDPLATVVAFAVIDPGATFDALTVGALVVYVPAWAVGGRIMHQAALRDGGGWIMAGLHNERSESWERLTPATYVGTVARIYVWPAR